jgi:hypothetical protein
MIWLRILFGRLSVVTSFALMAGGAAALLSPRLGLEMWWCFVFGSFFPVGPLLAYFASARALRRRLEAWRQLQKDGLITQEQFKQVRTAALEWYTQTWFGESSLANLGDEPADPAAGNPPEFRAPGYPEGWSKYVGMLECPGKPQFILSNNQGCPNFLRSSPHLGQEGCDQQLGPSLLGRDTHAEGLAVVQVTA